MSDIHEIEADSLEDAIRQLITAAAGGDVDIHMRTRGFDPRRTGATTIRAEIGDAAPSRGGRDSRDDRDDERDEAPRSRARGGRDSSDDGDDDNNDRTAPAEKPARDRRPSTLSEDERPTVEMLEEEADVAADFLEGLLDAMDIPGDLSIKILEDAAIVDVLEGDAGALIGRRGQTLEAIQELARCSLQRELQRRTRVRIDVEGYRERRMEKLLDKADEVIDDVLANGGSIRLEPMDVFERKAVHELAAGVEGIVSRSIGREPGRRVVIEVED